MNLEDCRRFYADEVRLAAGLSVAPLVAAYARVPREKFLGPSPWQVASPDSISMALMGLSGSAYVTTADRSDLYHNVLVALDPDRQLNNGQPSALARWIDALQLQAGDRVYHLGCGVGYYTAIMADVVGATGSVTASEVDAGLAARAQENLAGYANVSVHVGDGAAFDPGPCDAIFINAGVTHPHTVWLERLSPGGRLVLPLTGTMDSANFGGGGFMTKITAGPNGFAARVVSPVGIFSCTSVRDPQMNVALLKAMGSKALLKLRSVRTDSHLQQESCLAHGTDVCLSTEELPLEKGSVP
jgi:protein-L-isoaspartate(D-aspartate) O-methyltransferase